MEKRSGGGGGNPKIEEGIAGSEAEMVEAGTELSSEV
jgi:hypothetical protein